MISLKDKLDYLFIGAHPDDCEIMAGGTLLSLVAQKKRVGILDLTYGELGSNGNITTRKREARQATKIAGIDYRDCLGLKDGSLSLTDTNIIKVVRTIRKTQPDIIFTFKANNRHPDHEATHYLVKQATFLSGLTKYHTDSAKYVFRPSALIFFGEPYYLHDRPDFFVDVTLFYNKKIQLVNCYSSQVKVGRTSPQHKTLLGSDFFWNALQGRESWYGSLIGNKYAEGFWSDSRPKISDPILHFKKVIN